MHLGICRYPTHYSVDVPVHWHSQNIAQHEVTLYKIGNIEFSTKISLFTTIFFTFLRTQMRLGIPGKPTHYNVYVQVYWHCQNVAQNEVIWYKNIGAWGASASVTYMTLLKSNNFHLTFSTYLSNLIKTTRTRRPKPTHCNSVHPCLLVLSKR